MDKTYCAEWFPYDLRFRFEARTSRGVMHTKRTYFIRLWDADNPKLYSIGECALFHGLSREDDAGYETRLDKACMDPVKALTSQDSSIRCGFEMAFNNLRGVYSHSVWREGFYGIPINGLVWMGDKALMLNRINDKIGQGFRCVKLKIGGIDFDDELELIRYIRKMFTPDTLELRLDANGAFNARNVLKRLDALAPYSIHSIEQPIAPGQYDLMADVCRQSPIPIALDEELIGVTTEDFKQQLLGHVKCSYIILKPSLCGGFKEADMWIATARERGIGWWATSALESNIGLRCIAEWVDKYRPTMTQGLGTGELYENNIGSPLTQQRGSLYAVPPGPIPDFSWHNKQ
ncbi:MAG: o-succinylbenzoate synthase [Bacteroidales bacterium]|nr:o-succinylbenzoate synthase [Bacteroidales bacterium]